MFLGGNLITLDPDKPKQTAARIVITDHGDNSYEWDLKLNKLLSPIDQSDLLGQNVQQTLFVLP